jgi:hypothetical protein
MSASLQAVAVAAAPGVVSVRYMVDADASPGLLSRLLQPFAKRDVTPDRMWSHRSAETMHVELAVHALPAEYAHMIEGNLRQVVGVLNVVPVLAERNSLAA